MGRKSVTPPKNNVETATNEQIINKYLFDGHDVDTLFFLLTRHKRNFAFIKNDKERHDLCVKHGIPVVDFDAKGRQRLQEQIRKCKSAYSKQEESIDILRSLSENDGSALKVSEIPVITIPRFSTGIEEIDYVFGKDAITNQVGIPEGSCTVVGSPKGVGKTRLMVKLASLVGKSGVRSNSRGDSGVLYIQNEEKKEIFRSRYARFWTDKHNIRLSASNDLLQQLALINEFRPMLVIIDSLQDTLQARHPRGMATILSAYKSVAETAGTSFLIISHVNGEGKLKGGTYIGHKIDIELILERGMIPGEFTVSCPEKNRYGSSGRIAMFRHTDDGVEVIRDTGPGIKHLSSSLSVPRPVIRTPISAMT
jgi:predicted ATP-dependent serine protease